MKTETINFLKQSQKNINELQRERKNLIQYQQELVDALDIEDIDERNNAYDEAERKHNRCIDNLQYLEKEIASSLTPKVAEDLVNSLDPESIQERVQKFETALFDDEKVSIN